MKGLPAVPTPSGSPFLILYEPSRVPRPQNFCLGNKLPGEGSLANSRQAVLTL